ncbi:DEAD/DEAH box helicase family protein [Lentilactobacillus sp. G22-6]|uniref:DEAD/DEAH box helicase n=1 Tax=Lentilactobacillus dabitei TaxID=2831523 RepID=UPI001C280933|nr:helicase-related protein [Lentilactobacillus dabitei]MBU9789300.1 DEAD/DEAH box helicase family protein [Lentilactobacillus dabitei]
MINHISDLYGRQISSAELSAAILELPEVKRRPAIQLKPSLMCSRCGSRLKRSQANLPNGQYYCYVCIQMKRMDTLHDLAFVDEPNQFTKVSDALSWEGQLTPLQAECAEQVVRIFKKRQHHLLWAVTGAGKTEMLFKGIEWAVRYGKRIRIASPRVDVCIELFPRIQAAFAKTSIVLLHGKSEQPYKYSQITICTTHQLLRFYHAFDVLIIDEVDVFPFSGNPMLHFGVNNAIKTAGSMLYLTATPDKHLLTQVRKGRLSISYLPIRYHGHLLPEPTIIKIKGLSQGIDNNRLDKRVLKMIRQLMSQQQRFLLFVPHIKDLAAVATAIKDAGIIAKYDTVFAADPERLEKVSAMRHHELDFIITTTILERGVTFPGIDVLVLKADNDIFSAAALIQIAGRVGRSSDRPTGRVLFYAEARAANIRSCQRQIRKMNRKAAEI